MAYWPSITMICPCCLCRLRYEMILCTSMAIIVYQPSCTHEEELASSLEWTNTQPLPSWPQPGTSLHFHTCTEVRTSFSVGREHGQRALITKQEGGNGEKRNYRSSSKRREEARFVIVSGESGPITHEDQYESLRDARRPCGYFAQDSILATLLLHIEIENQGTGSCILHLAGVIVLLTAWQISRYGALHDGWTQESQSFSI